MFYKRLSYFRCCRSSCCHLEASSTSGIRDVRKGKASVVRRRADWTPFIFRHHLVHGLHNSRRTQRGLVLRASAQDGSRFAFTGAVSVRDSYIYLEI